MTSDRDHHFMGLALAQAQAAAAAGEVPVGAVVVDPETDAILAQAGNAPISTSDPTGHAEIRAMRAAASELDNYRLTKLELFVTLEPCVMCAGAISHARIGRVIYGATDPKGGGVDHGPQVFKQPTCHWRPQVTGGVRAEEASDLLKTFFRARRQA